MTKRREGWVNYSSVIHDVQALVGVDTSADLSSTLPQLGRVSVQLREGSEEVLAEGDEDLMSSSVDAITSALERQGWVKVGQILSAGQLHVYAYGPDEADITGLDLSEVPLKPRLASGVDSGHTAYWDDLYPNPLGWTYVDNRRGLSKLEGLGEDPSIPRFVEHRFAFDSATNATAFASELVSQGFVSGEPRGIRDEWVVVGRKEHVVEMPAINSLTYALVRSAQEFLGGYRGWALVEQEGLGGELE
tara:strand:- start:1723 stop:2463 length:741 start_codon:yes stop_codon:yes gene_type:complete